MSTTVTKIQATTSHCRLQSYNTSCTVGGTYYYYYYMVIGDEKQDNYLEAHHAMSNNNNTTCDNIDRVLCPSGESLPHIYL